MSRRDQIAVLLALRFAWIPGPPTATGRIVATSSALREAPSKWRLCPTCDGKGKRGRLVCDHCRGAGRLLVDDYTGRVASAPAASAAEEVARRREQWAKRDAELARLERLERMRLPAADPRSEAAGDVWTNACEQRQRLLRASSLAELERCLGRLEREWPWLARGLGLVYGDDWTDSLALMLPMRSSVVECAERALDLLSAWMPQVIRLPSWALEARPPQLVGKGRWANAAAQARRNALVVDLAGRGISHVSIGARVGVSRQQVDRIVKEAKGAVAA